MAEVVNQAQQEFWQSPVPLETGVEAPLLAAVHPFEEACTACGREFMIGARFCHACGRARATVDSGLSASAMEDTVWEQSAVRARAWAHLAAVYWREASFPEWLHYLHFHEIKRWIGLPTGALYAFMIGLGCVLGALGVGLFYHASNLAEFQAIQMWRIEWLLAATAAFVAGILLKKTTDRE